MEVYRFQCDVCGREKTADVRPHRGDICFGCHVKSVDLGFRYGKENFHGPTIRERQQHIVSDAAAKGIHAVPAKSYGF
jgi:hypothetical protein